MVILLEIFIFCGLLYVIPKYGHIFFREDSSDTDLDGDFSDLETPEGKLCLYFNNKKSNVI